MLLCMKKTHTPRKVAPQCGHAADRGGRKMNFLTAGVMGLTLMLGATAAYAPEAAPQDHGRIHDVAYCVEESGRIVDRAGAPKGWMIGNEVYDNAWNLKYRMEGKSIRDVPGI
jgi:hypothetical protein